jgi:uncharacterized protein YdaU (DUF1376 family)
LNPDSYFRFYGCDFFNAIGDYEAVAVAGYLRALWKYWSHYHCDGIPDDDVLMMSICRCPKADWSRTKGVIFGGPPFFFLENGKWHQKRAMEEWVELKAQYDRQLKRTEAARAAASSVTRSVTASVTDTVTACVTENVTGSQPESESESYKERGKTPDGSLFKKPTIDDIKTQCISISLPLSESEKFFNYYESKGWRVGKSPMKSWKAALNTWKLRYQERLPSGRSGYNPDGLNRGHNSL